MKDYPHGRLLGCVQLHSPEDAVVGEALCPDCYEWENAVIFNARVGALWHHTVIAVHRHLAKAAGIRVRAFNRSWRLSFAKVVEFQRRGSSTSTPSSASTTSMTARPCWTPATWSRRSLRRRRESRSRIR